VPLRPDVRGPLLYGRMCSTPPPCDDSRPKQEVFFLYGQELSTRLRVPTLYGLENPCGGGGGGSLFLPLGSFFFCWWGLLGVVGFFSYLSFVFVVVVWVCFWAQFRFFVFSFVLLCLFFFLLEALFCSSYRHISKTTHPSFPVITCDENGVLFVHARESLW